MARFQCKCGNDLSNSLVPNDVVYHVYSDIEWDNILRMESIQTLDIPEPEHDVWKCNHCERIYIFNMKGEVIKVYTIESQNDG